MQFKHEQTQKDGGGNLIVTAETPTEVLEVIEHFQIFDKDAPEGVIAMAEALKAGPPFVHQSEPSKHKWYVVTSALDESFTKPYTELLAKITGYTGYLPNEMDLTALHPRRLCHTHITNKIALEHGHFTFEVFDTAEDWNNKTAAENADINGADYLAEDVGKRRFEREYIESGNGQMKRNPNYLKRYKASPGLGAPWFWAAIFEWWLTNHASDKQKAILEATDTLRGVSNRTEPEYHLRRGAGDECYLIGYSLYYADPNGKIDWDGKGTKASCISWDDFAKLADQPVTA